MKNPLVYDDNNLVCKMARKRDGRDTTPQSNIIRREDLHNSKGIELHDTFRRQLEQLGLQIREMPGDGNCLFRALGDQLDGHCRSHLKHRNEVTHYMLQNREDFEPFVEDDVTFEKYIRQLRQPGTYAGNDVIVAFARLHRLDVVIHQMNTPPWVIQGGDASSSDARCQLHVSYSNGDHYSSVRRSGDNKHAPANIRLTTMCICDDRSSAKKKSTKLQQEEKERLSREEEYNSMIECIIAATDCQDRNLIEDTLQSCNHDVEKSIEVVMMLLDDQLHEESLDSSLPQVDNGARPKTTSPKISAKSERKRNKRERAVARHKTALTSETFETSETSHSTAINNQLSHADTDVETLVKSLSTVQI